MFRRQIEVEIEDFSSLVSEADFTAAEPWMILRLPSIQKSTRIVLDKELVAPNIWRPVFTTFKPFQTMGTEKDETGR